jgi:hypothetical protein
MEDVGIFYGLLVYFTAIWYILWTCGIFYGYLVHFPRFGMLRHKKSGSPAMKFVQWQQCLRDSFHCNATLSRFFRNQNASK